MVVTPPTSRSTDPLPPWQRPEKRATSGTLGVGISEFALSLDPSDVLITFSLGSCLGVAFHDPVAQVGGMIHCLLPSSRHNPDRAANGPAMFVDTGVAMALRRMFDAGARRESLVISVAGCGHPVVDAGAFSVGRSNLEVLKRLLDKNGLSIAASDTGGSRPRTMRLYMDSGRVTVATNGVEHAL